MEQIGVKFKSGHMLVTLDPKNKKIDITATIDDIDLSGKVTLKPVKNTKESK